MGLPLKVAEEAHFHDEWALGTRLEDVNVKEAFESFTAPENQFILTQIGSLRGKRVLDLGPGLGESSVYFALQGAHVTSIDVSPEMCALVQRLAEVNGVRVESIVASAEAFDALKGGFDVVYAGNLLHHIDDRDLVLRNIHAVLKSGGRFFAIDPLAHNPVINIYRRMANKVRTAGESPLRMSDLELFKKYFIDVGHREFWILSLVLFLKYYFVDRIHPNEDRYWKRILKEGPATARWLRPLQKIDALLSRLPLIRCLAWNIVIWGTKTDTSNET